MENLKPLSNFFAAIDKDFRIGTTHIAIYAALLQIRLNKGFINPVDVFSRDIIGIAKISSTYTYIKCVQDLSDYGYIIYVRSFKKTQASKIYFTDIDE